MSLNQRIKIVRQKEKLNQTAFSESIGISQSMLNRYEKEGKEVPAKVIASIIEKYKIYSNWLLFGEGGQEPKYQEEYIRKEIYQEVTEQALTRENELLREIAELRKEKIKTLEAERIEGGTPVTN